MMTNHLLATIDAFAQEVQGKLAKSELVANAGADSPPALTRANVRVECYGEFAKMLHTIRAQVEDLIKEGETRK